MKENKHWASELEIGDRALATIRHQSDGTKNIHNALIIVAMNKTPFSSILASYKDTLIEIPYNELSPYDESEPKIHELKTWPIFWDEVFMGRKTFEVRLNDRNYNVGDKLILKEWNPHTKQYTGRQIARTVSYILDGGNFGIYDEFIVMSIQ